MRASTNKTAAPVHLSQVMLSLLAESSSSAAVVLLVTASVQLLSACNDCKRHEQVEAVRE